MQPSQGTGTTLVFVTSAVTMLLTALRRQGVKRGDVDTTHSASTQTSNVLWRTFRPSRLADPGGLGFTAHFDPADAIPFNAPETLRIEFPPDELASPAITTGAKIAFNGYVNAQDEDFHLLDDETMKADVTIKASGVYTITAPVTA